MRSPPGRFLTELSRLRDQGLAGEAIARMLRLPRAEAERLGLVAAAPWSHLAWRIEANRVRWRRRHWR